MPVRRTVIVAEAAAAASVMWAALTTVLTPEGEGDCRQNGSEHYKSRAAGCADQNNVGRVSLSAMSPAIVVRRQNVISTSMVVVGQRLIDDQGQVEFRRQRWMSTVSSDYS